MGVTFNIKSQSAPDKPVAYGKPPLPQSVYATHLKAKEVLGQTEIKKTSGKSVIHEGGSTEVVHPGLVGDCAVSVTGGRTVNLGNYESVKIAVTLTMPCPKDGLNEAYEFATTWVGEKLTEAVKAVS